MHIRIIIPTQALLLLAAPGAQRHAHIPRGILAANHEADLARGIGRDGGVGVLGDGEDFFARPFQVADQLEMEPLVFGCNGNA